MMRMALKIALLESHRTQRDIAREAGLPESRVSDIVRGWANPRVEEAQALSKTLDISIAQLFPHEDALLKKPRPGVSS